MSKHTLSVLVEDQPGVLTRIAGLFSRRGFNIESLAVGPTEHEGISRMTIVVNVDESPLEQVTKQLNKLTDGDDQGISGFRGSEIEESPIAAQGAKYPSLKPTAQRTTDSFVQFVASAKK